MSGSWVSSSGLHRPQSCGYRSLRSPHCKSTSITPNQPLSANIGGNWTISISLQPSEPNLLHPALFPSSAPPRWPQYCPLPVALPQPFRRHSGLGFRGCISISPGISSERSIGNGTRQQTGWAGLGSTETHALVGGHGFCPPQLACYPSFSPPTLMQGPRRPPTADELLQVPLHETKWAPTHPPGNPKMAVWDRAVQLIRARPHPAHRLRPSTARLGGLHPAHASPRAVQRRRTTPGRAEHLWTKGRSNTFGKEPHFNQLVAQPSREAIGVLVLMLPSATFRLVLHVYCCSFQLTTSLGDSSRVDSRVGCSSFLLHPKHPETDLASSKRGLPLLDNPFDLDRRVWWTRVTLYPFFWPPFSFTRHPSPISADPIMAVLILLSSPHRRRHRN